MAQQPQQNFVDRVGPTVASAWLNEVDLKRLQLAWSAGNQIIGLRQPKYTTAQQARSSTIVLVDDTYLVWLNMPAGTYLVEGFLQFQGSISGGQGMDWRVNVAGTRSGSNTLNYNGVVNNAPLGNTLNTNANGTVAFATINTAITDYVNFSAIFTTTTVGEISLQWCQNSSNANATVLNDRSWMSVTPLA